MVASVTIIQSQCRNESQTGRVTCRVTHRSSHEFSHFTIWSSLGRVNGFTQVELYGEQKCLIKFPYKWKHAYLNPISFPEPAILGKEREALG